MTRQEKVIQIIREEFPRGMHEDYIDVKKVMNVYSTENPDEKLTNEFVQSIISKYGVPSGARFFFLTTSQIKTLTSKVEKLLNEYSILYYTELYRNNLAFFSTLTISDADALRNILRTNDTKYYYGLEYCARNMNVDAGDEVAKIFKSISGSELSLDYIAQKLPYVPRKKISTLLADSNKYLLTLNKRYVSVNQIFLDSNEIFTAKEEIKSDLQKKKFVLLSDYKWATSFRGNPNIAKNVLLNWIYEKYFSEKFLKQGNRILNKEPKFKTVTDDQNSCKNFEELLLKYNEITTATLFARADEYRIIHRKALKIAAKCMTRVNKNLFVKDKFVKFDVDGVDKIIGHFSNEKIIPLKKITSFTGFPAPAYYSWNLFLLESFLRKYSRHYSFCCSQGINNSNLGAIYPKSMKITSYLDLQVKVILQEKVPLLKETIGNFLTQQGYCSKSFDKLTCEIINKAKKICTGQYKGAQ